MKEESGMNFLEHAEELRKRIIYSVIPILVFFVPCYLFSKQLFDLLMRPIIMSLPEGSSLIFTRPAEGFLTYLKVSLFFSFFLSVPFILYNAWHFVSPALYKREKRVVIPLVTFGTLFFILGALFCYFVAAPQGLRFLLGEYTTEYVKAFPSIKEALSFLSALMIGFGVVFEFPLSDLHPLKTGSCDGGVSGEAEKIRSFDKRYSSRLHHPDHRRRIDDVHAHSTFHFL